MKQGEGKREGERKERGREEENILYYTIYIPLIFMKS